METPLGATAPSPARVYVPAVALALAFVWLFHGTLVDLAERWENPAFSHGWIVAPAAIGIAWYKRDTWLGTPIRPASIAGLGAILFGLVTLVLAAWTDVMFMPFLSMLVVVGGLILFFGGWEWFRRLLFPYAFLYFMVPWPDELVTYVSFPMQINTSTYAAVLANIVGVRVVQEGVNLSVPAVHAQFQVAVACSGMHSLVALLCLAAAFAYFTPVALWKRWLLFGLGLPMAFCANVLRVFLILCVANWISPELAGKAFHDWSSPALFLINTLGLIAIRNAMLREPKPRAHAAAVGAASASGSASSAAAMQPAVEDDDAF